MSRATTAKRKKLMVRSLRVSLLDFERNMVFTSYRMSVESYGRAEY